MITRFGHMFMQRSFAQARNLALSFKFVNFWLWFIDLIFPLWSSLALAYAERVHMYSSHPSGSCSIPPWSRSRLTSFRSSVYIHIHTSSRTTTTKFLHGGKDSPALRIIALHLTSHSKSFFFPLRPHLRLLKSNRHIPRGTLHVCIFLFFIHVSLPSNLKKKLVSAVVIMYIISWHRTFTLPSSTGTHRTLPLDTTTIVYSITTTLCPNIMFNVPYVKGIILILCIWTAHAFRWTACARQGQFQAWRRLPSSTRAT